MSIFWYDASRPLPSVTLAKYGITMNGAAAEFFRGSPKVTLGLEPEKRIVYLKPAPESDESAFKMPSIGDRAASARISCREFIEFVTQKMAISMEQTSRYSAEWQESDKVLAVHLARKLGTSNRKSKQADKSR